jgi:hypothetical protein
VASSFAILQDSTLQGRPQLVFYASANSSFKFRATGGFDTETIDARVGSHINYEWNEERRLSLGWMHQSGHASDEIEDRDLFGLNLGNEQFYARFIQDVDKKFRIGGTVRLFFDSDPGINSLGGDQFIEWMFCGSIDDETKPIPYLSVGLEEYGRKDYFYTLNAQIGAYMGSHFKQERSTNARLALGYYGGADPRLKYMQFKSRRADFLYLGLYFDI